MVECGYLCCSYYEDNPPCMCVGENYVVEVMKEGEEEDRELVIYS